MKNRFEHSYASSIRRYWNKQHSNVLRDLGEKRKALLTLKGSLQLRTYMMAMASFASASPYLGIEDLVENIDDGKGC
jgi:hypothetical protein